MADNDGIEPEIEPEAQDTADPSVDQNEEQAVGYGKPPRKNQFPPGRSGNPRGRPRGAKGLKAELREELDEWVTITSDGETRRIRKRRLVIKALAAKAAKGNVAAADKLLSLVIQAEGFEDERATAPRSVPASMLHARPQGERTEFLSPCWRGGEIVLVCAVPISR